MSVKPECKTRIIHKCTVPSRLKIQEDDIIFIMHDPIENNYYLGVMGPMELKRTVLSKFKITEN